MEKEKRKLMKKADGFQIIEYIRSSIEIIMNLKVEDLEREVRVRNNGEVSADRGMDSLNSTNSLISNPNPSSFVLASMKEALLQAEASSSSVKQHGQFAASSTGGGLLHELNNSLAQRVSSDASLPPKEYEKMLQKLENDIRGHIRVSTLNSSSVTSLNTR